MSFPKYASYRDSGVEWLGEVPSHWNITPLKHLASFEGGGTPSKDNPHFWDGEIPWASAKDLKSDVLTSTKDHLSKHAIESGAAKLIPKGAVIVLVRGMMLARTFPVTLAGLSTTINQDLKALIAFSHVESRFLTWCLRGTATETLNRLEEAGHGTKALRMDAWISLELPIPPYPEQAVIASVLDRETAKIDGLIEAQRQLIDLLKEKRQAIISHAVTKGLDPTAPMKPSGVEWLGDVPAHWEVRRFSNVIEITEGQVDPRDEPFASMPLIAPNHIEPGTGRLIALETASTKALRAESMPFERTTLFIRKSGPLWRK